MSKLNQMQGLLADDLLIPGSLDPFTQHVALHAVKLDKHVKHFDLLIERWLLDIYLHLTTLLRKSKNWS